MIEQLNRKGTLRLIFAIRKQAERDIRLYNKETAKTSRKRRKGSCFISSGSYKSAVNYLDVEFPVIREILGECFKEK